MFKQLLFLICIIVSVHLNAQTGIGTTTPNASAKLDVYSDNKGFLPPRVTLTSATDNTTISTPAEGLLVYNKGSVGLQAGYYYWNGANWATIATATSAGNGVTASDMVKLYGEAHSTATGKMGNTNGYPFTVPVSGRYLFDFSSSATTLNGGTNTIYFQVRQGTTVLGSDNQSSYNNNVHVEYNGKVEVNLQAGISYNVYNYATSGSFETNDYDRVYYKLVAGNLPVTGQTVDYVSVQASSDLGSIIAGTAVKFNTTLAGNIPYDPSTGLFTLSAGKTYRLTGVVTLGTQAAGTGSSAEANIVWRTGTAASGTNIGNYAQILSGNSTYNGNGQGIADIIYTPTVNTTVLLYVNGISSTVSFRGGYTNAIIEQIGSSAIVNPWVLTGNDVYNTSGKVGIGTNSPTTKLDVTGDVNVTGNLNIAAGSANVNLATNALLVGNSSGDEGGEIQFTKAATNTTLTNKVIVDVFRNQLRLWEGGTNSKGVSIDLSKAPDGVGGELVWKKTGIVDAGTFVTLDNLKVTVTTGGSRGLSIAAVSSNFVCNIAGWYGLVGGGSGNSAENVTYTTTPSGSVFGWSFPAAGNTAQYNILDLTSNRFYRVTMMIGSGYYNNFISIERLY